MRGCIRLVQAARTIYSGLESAAVSLASSNELENYSALFFTITIYGVMFRTISWSILRTREQAT